MTTSGASASSVGETVDRDWPCMGCGYNLRTLAADGICPECGRGVRESLNARPLSHADSRWTYRIWLGFTLAAMGVIGWILITIVLGLLNARILQFLPPYIIDGTVLERLPWILLLLPTPVLLRAPERQGDRPQWWARLLLPALLLNLLVLVMNTVLVNSRIGSAGTTILLLGYGIEKFFLVMQLWLILSAVEDVAGRIPAQPMLVEARWIRRIFVPLLVASAANWLIISIARIVNPLPPSPGQHWVGDFWGPILSQIETMAHIGAFPLWLYLPVHLFRFSRHIGHARRVEGQIPNPEPKSNPQIGQQQVL